MLVLYVIAYLDRANVSFAALQMQPALGLTDEEFGWGVGIFFVGLVYIVVAEVSSRADAEAGAT